ncbi:MAG: type II toxin-antitoxin system VapC family toxin [Limisphaerales bacterium]
MKPPFVLDTSALLAHFGGEPGHEDVEHVLEAFPAKVSVCAVTWLELEVRLKELLPEAVDQGLALEIYGHLVAATLPVTREVAQRAFELRSRCRGRLPNSDALIAATASLAGACLIHRDPHFEGIPVRLLRQHRLADKHPGPVRRTQT